MFGPALLGLLADFTSVQTALCANAALLVVVMGVFALAVRIYGKSLCICVAIGSAARHMLIPSASWAFSSSGLVHQDWINTAVLTCVHDKKAYAANKQCSMQARQWWSELSQMCLQARETRQPKAATR